jgi:hypothetical protein
VAESAATRKQRAAAELADSVGPDDRAGAQLEVQDTPPEQVEGRPGLSEQVQADRIRQLIEDQPTNRRGSETSEFKATVASSVVGVLVFVVGLFAPGIPDEALREVLMWIAGLLVGGPVATYTVARTSLKRKLADALGGVLRGIL